MNNSTLNQGYKNIEAGVISVEWDIHTFED
jgi:hypothetical protein